MSRALFVIVLMLLGGEANAFCSVPFFRTPKGEIGEGTMTVTTGQDCRFGTTPLNSDSLSFTQRPRNGTVTIAAAGVIVYKSKPGFIGEDSFAFTRSGYDDFREKITQRARVTVRVSP
jgi:hypothetical protein